MPFLLMWAYLYSGSRKVGYIWRANKFAARKSRRPAPTKPRSQCDRVTPGFRQRRLTAFSGCEFIRRRVAFIYSCAIYLTHPKPDF